VLHRDLAAVFRERAGLFPAEKLPGFAKATGDLALLFGGLDLGQDVLPGISPWVTLVAGRADFAPGTVPDQPLPAAAAILELREPERLGPLLVSAFQTGVGLANADREQKGLDPLLLELRLAGTETITTARFFAPRDGAGLDLRHNLVPACAWSGERFVVGTHASLVEELVRAGGGFADLGAAVETLELGGDALAEVVDANREALVAREVLRRGRTREQAEEDLRLAASLLRSADLALEVEYRSESEIELRATLDLEPAGD
jgi:hypothetical protein